MFTITIEEAKRVCLAGTIVLRGNTGRLTGHVVTRRECPAKDGVRVLPSGKEMPWTPAAKIGWQ